MIDEKLSILIAAYNEQDSVPGLLDELESATSTWSGDVEVILVDDGSSDDTWLRVTSHEASNFELVGIRLRRNMGKSVALRYAVESSSGDILATLDADLQDSPQELMRLVTVLRETNSDLIVGRKINRADPAEKRLPSKLFNYVTSRATGLKLHDHNCGLKVGRRIAFESVPMYGDMHRFFAAMVHAEGFAVTENSVKHRPRMHGKSKFGFERYIHGLVDLLSVVVMTRYRYRPGHLFGGLGLASGAAGSLLLSALLLLKIFQDQPIDGRPLFFLGVLLIILSVQFISLGVLAELQMRGMRPNGETKRDETSDTHRSKNMLNK